MSKEKLSRRQLLSTLGAAGVGMVGSSFITTGLVSSSYFTEGTVTQSVYGGDENPLCIRKICPLNNILDLVGYEGGNDGDQAALISYRPGTNLGGGSFY